MAAHPGPTPPAPVERSGIDRFFDAFYGALGYLAGAILAVMTVSVFLSVVMRALKSQALEGLDEVPRYLFVWLVAIGSAAAMHRNEHTVLDYFVNRLPPRTRAMLSIVTHCVMIWLFLTILQLSFTLVPNAALQTSPALGLRLDYVFAALPVGAVLIIIPMVRNILRLAGEVLWPKRS